MNRESFGRVTATNPGKHGPLDWRIELNETAPTHGEMAFMLGMILLAEERYNGSTDLGASLFWIVVIDALQRMRVSGLTPEKVRKLAERAERI